jgi:hypothetical protein
MEIDATPEGLILLKGAFKPVVFENEEGEQIKIKLVSDGFEVESKKEVCIIHKTEE